MKKEGNKHSKHKRSSRGNYEGFSLIEVTISIAITAVALVSLMGMLPAGMRMMREAGDRAVETRIHQQIIGELQLSEWDSLSQYSGQVRYYDDQGIQIETTDPDFDLIHVYTARINVPTIGNRLPQTVGGGSYSGVRVPASPNPDPNLQLVIVEVTSVIDSEFDSGAGFDNPDYVKAIRTFQATVARLGSNIQ